MVGCVVKGCKSVKYLHSPSAEYRDKWIDIVGDMCYNNEYGRKRKFIRVCSNHFQEEDFLKKEPNKRHKLKPNVIPSINLELEVPVRVRPIEFVQTIQWFQPSAMKDNIKTKNYTPTIPKEVDSGKATIIDNELKTLQNHLLNEKDCDDNCLKCYCEPEHGQVSNLKSEILQESEIKAKIELHVCDSEQDNTKQEIDVKQEAIEEFNHFVKTETKVEEKDIMVKEEIKEEVVDVNS